MCVRVEESKSATASPGLRNKSDIWSDRINFLTVGLSNSALVGKLLKSRDIFKNMFNLGNL